MIPDRPMEDQLFSERVARLNTLVPMFLDAGIQPVYENCMNYGGQGWTFTERLLDAVPGMKEVTGLSRKYLIPLLEHLDQTRVTVRIGDKRQLRATAGKDLESAGKTT